MPLPRFGPEPFVISFAVLLLVAPILLAAFLLWLASVNHRSADHRGGRVWKQAIAIGGFVTAALLVLAVFVAASRA